MPTLTSLGIPTDAIIISIVHAQIRKLKGHATIKQYVNNLQTKHAIHSSVLILPIRRNGQWTPYQPTSIATNQNWNKSQTALCR
jgi:hypothetical protein